MAELPKYQPISRGLVSTPQLDFASTREAYRATQSMQQGLDKISKFAFEKVAETSVKEAAQYTIDNPPTPEQIELAKAGEITMEDLIPKGGAAAQQTVRKLMASQLRNTLQVDLETGYLNNLEEVKSGNITDDVTLKSKLNAPIQGMLKVLNGIDPEEALKFQAYAANSGFNITVAANKEFDNQFRKINDQVSEQSVLNASKIADEVIPNYGLSNLKVIQDTVSLLDSNVEKSIQQGTVENAKLQASVWSNKKAALFTTVISNGIDDVVRLSASGNPQAEDALFVTLGQFDEAASIFNINPTAVEKLKNETIEKFHSARIKQEYNAAENKVDFLNKFNADAKSGPVGNLFNKDGIPSQKERLTRGISFDEVERLQSAFAADINKINSENKTRQNLLNDRVSELKGVLTDGSTVTEKDMLELVQLADDLGVEPGSKLAKSIQELFVVNSDTKLFLTLNSDELTKYESDLNLKTSKEGASPLTAARLDNLRTFRSNRQELINKDPVSAMSRFGGEKAIPLNWTANQEDFVADVKKRITDTTTFANQNGKAPKYFTLAEKASLGNLFNQSDTMTQAGILVKLTDAFGNKAPEAFAEISDQSPIISHLGGLSLVSTQQETIVDALNGLQQIKAGNSPLETKDATNNKFTALQFTLGSAYSNLPKTRSAIIKTANAIYTQRAINNGQTEFDEEMYTKAFQEASGAIYTGEDIYGGVITYQEKQMPIPNNIKQNDFEDIINNATYEDFQKVANGTLKDSIGRAYSIKSLQNAVIAPIDNETAYLYAEDYRNNPGALRFYTGDNRPVIINLKQLGNLVKVD